ncbi:anthranilate synthase beta subunit 1, chloroplastic-like isoform X3 [Punica granatum]|uniref:anthranilate synthase n=1 Tax=Punica granatum TaxID=22663 RepID=A0A6P8D2L9_PUNGR|nr:anthranilate synthase beta subunit 1, chloroplastic-like isoform X3 [Punica granatum]
MAATAAGTSHPSSLLLPKSSTASSQVTQQGPGHLRIPASSPLSKLGLVARNGDLCTARAATSVTVLETNSRSPLSAKKNEKPIIVIDNYDSFTYNLCQYMGELGCKFEVYRNDELTVEELKRKNPRGVLISPGPGAPQDSGISLQTVLELGPIVPLFGVCMGLQCIGEAFGGKIVRSPYGVVHGKSSPVYYDEKGEDGLFAGLSNPFLAGRYHSLVIEKESFPSEELEVTAWTEDGLIMAARHKKYKHLQIFGAAIHESAISCSLYSPGTTVMSKCENAQGVQFHPESIITTEGKTIISNFVKMIKRKEAEFQN